MQVKEKGSGSYQKPETNKRKTNYTTFTPDEDIVKEPSPEESPEDLSRRKTPCEELDFPRISTELYNKFYFFINEEDMREAA